MAWDGVFKGHANFKKHVVRTLLILTAGLLRLGKFMNKFGIQRRF